MSLRAERRPQPLDRLLEPCRQFRHRLRARRLPRDPDRLTSHDQDAREADPKAIRAHGLLRVDQRHGDDRSAGGQRKPSGSSAIRAVPVWDGGALREDGDRLATLEQLDAARDGPPLVRIPKDGKRAEPRHELLQHRVAEELRLGHEAQPPPRREREEEPVEHRLVVRGQDDRADLRDVICASQLDAPQGCEDGLHHGPGHPVEQHALLDQTQRSSGATSSARRRTTSRCTCGSSPGK